MKKELLKRRGYREGRNPDLVSLQNICQLRNVEQKKEAKQKVDEEHSFHQSCKSLTGKSNSEMNNKRGARIHIEGGRKQIREAQ